MKGSVIWSGRPTATRTRGGGGFFCSVSLQSGRKVQLMDPGHRAGEGKGSRDGAHFSKGHAALKTRDAPGTISLKLYKTRDHQG